MKKNIYKIHKYSGLTFGFFILLLAISGVSITLREELLPLVYSELFEINPGETELPVEALYTKANTFLSPEMRITNLYSSGSKDEAYLFLYNEPNLQFPTMLTINQFTGEIVGQMNMINNFFAIMLFMHANLFVGKAGSYLVGVLGFLLCLFVVSGIYIWLPRRNIKAKLNRTFSLKSPSLQKYHHFLGLVFSFPLIISGITGFLTVFDLSYYTARLLQKTPSRIEEMERPGTCTFEQQLNVVKSIPSLMQQNLISVHFCTRKNGLMKVSYGLHDKDFLEGYGRLVVDPVTNSVLQSFDSSKDPGSWNLKRLIIYPLHTGQFFGTLGRLINFVTGISLSVIALTGFFLYRQRKKRNPGFSSLS